MSDPFDPQRIKFPPLRPVNGETVPDFPYRLTESPEEAAARREHVRERQLKRWWGTVPLRFHGATVESLTPEQNPDGRVSTWWTEHPKVLTLLLRSDESGVGKSYAAYAVGAHAAEQGAWAAAWTVAALNDAIRPGNNPTAYETAQECDLLVLDDLGREKMTEWTLERLHGVIDARWANLRRTVVTTQVSGEKLLERYGDPILDRLRDDAWIIAMTKRGRRGAAKW
jgi:DNA replication protein DnaC